MAAATGSPCGACKFLRRKCASDCIFAPYFCSEMGPARFAAIHKVFGASNVSKLLLHVPVPDRCEAVVTIAYEAQARIRDPVYGCVAHIFALQQQVAYLQTQLMQMKAQMAQGMIDQQATRCNGDINQLELGNIGFSQNLNVSNYGNSSNNNYSISPQSSLDSIDQQQQHQHMQLRDHDYEPYAKKSRQSLSTDLTDLQELAFRMMHNEN